MKQGLLPYLPIDLILATYAAAPGNEIESGKFLSPESSAALAANTFGLFLNRAHDLPPLPGAEYQGWPATSVQLEGIVRFPWSGGRHPCLDVLIETSSALIGIESKRFEPFRSKSAASLSDAYWRPVWGDAMGGYERVRDALRDGTAPFKRLDAAQLIKHAFGLRSTVDRERKSGRSRTPMLFYLYAEPQRWPTDGRAIADQDLAAHREEASLFAEMVAGDEVAFQACSYGELLANWKAHPSADIRDHAAAIIAHFAP